MTDEEESKLKTTYSKGGIVGMNIKERDEYGMTKEEAKQFDIDSKKRLAKQRKEFIDIGKERDMKADVRRNAHLFDDEDISKKVFSEYGQEVNKSDPWGIPSNEGMLRSETVTYLDELNVEMNKLGHAIRESELMLIDRVDVLIKNDDELSRLKDHIDQMKNGQDIIMGKMTTGKRLLEDLNT